MKKIKQKIKEFFKEVVKEAVKESDINKQVAESIEKLRYDYLPHGACWMCSMPVSRSGGYDMWMGKMFCKEQCASKYSSLMQNPDQSFKYLPDNKGAQHPVESFQPE
jgi:hypothetical protein